MPILFALILAVSPATTPAEPPAKKPRLKCEWIHEVGTSRPRRVCEKRVEKPKPAEPTTDTTQQPTSDHSAQPQGANE